MLLSVMQNEKFNDLNFHAQKKLAIFLVIRI